MNRSLGMALASIILIGSFGNARAADMAVKAPMPPPVAAVYNWTGFYVGGHIGAVWGDTNQSFFQNNAAPFDPRQIAPVNFGRDHSARVIGGLHGGYNWQVAPSWVVGIEGDVSFLDGAHNAGPVATIDNTGVPLPTAPGNKLIMSNGQRELFSFRGRVGYAADNWLFYATGGVAFDYRSFNGGITSTANIGSIQTGDVTSFDTGWVAGGGVEWAPWHNGVLVRAEYLYYGFPSKTITAPCTACVPGAFNGPGVFTWSSNNFQVARVGISYKFGPY
jgi:outer membrane immunogenic protein